MHSKTCRSIARRVVPFVTACLVWGIASATPPYSGTIFLDPDIITPSDPNAFRSLTYAGQEMRNMFDRRCSCFQNYNAYLFDAIYADGLFIEVEVNPEYGSAALAQVPAEFYAKTVGHLPHMLRKDVQTMWIHKGDNAFGGGNNNLLIHTGLTAQSYIDSGILEEALVHEAGHTSLEADYATSAGWMAAQNADPDFISTYAAANPVREDISESILVWLAARHSINRIDATMKNTIESTIPHRLDFFSAQHFKLYPYTGIDTIYTDGFEQLSD